MDVNREIDVGRNNIAYIIGVVVVVLLLLWWLLAANSDVETTEGADAEVTETE